MTNQDEQSSGEAAEREELVSHEYALRDSVLGLQERFGYFFLAASGSAIAFALTQAKDESPACWMLTALVAILSWGVSFVLSALHLQNKVKGLLQDWLTVRIKLGKEPRLEGNPEETERVLARLWADMQASDKRSGQLARWALNAFLLGGIFYLVAQIQRACCACC